MNTNPLPPNTSEPSIEQRIAADSIGKDVITIPHRYSFEECNQMLLKHQQLMLDVDKQSQELAEYSAEKRKAIKGLSAEAKKLRQAVKKGVETREVEAYKVPNYTTGTISLMSKDGEELLRRPMTPEEQHGTKIIPFPQS